MLNVTDLSSYLYCPRQLYLKNIIKIPPPPKDVMLKGTIKHSVIEKLDQIEKQIVKNITKPLEKDQIKNIYEKNYKSIFLRILEKYNKSLLNFEIDPNLFFETSWPIYEREAKFRAYTVFDFINETKLVGEELWDNIEPKFISELKIISKDLRLKGKIDKLEMYKNKIIPVEMKSGKMPQTGVWPSNKIQLIAYCFLTQEHFNKPVKEGYIHYLDHQEKRKITLNPFSKIELLNIRDLIFKMLDQKQPPETLNNNKCEHCQLKEQCHSLK